MITFTMAELSSEENCNKIIEKCTKFLQDGCGCALVGKGVSCSAEFTEETVLANLNNCLELTSGELDLVILANIQAFTRIECVGEKRSGSPRSSFNFKGDKFVRKCFYTFMELDMQDIFSSKNTGNSMGFPEERTATQKECVKMRHPCLWLKISCAFLQNYVEENAIILPGRIPGFKSDDIRVLSSSESKMSVWRVYTSTCEVSNKQVVSYKKFIQLCRASGRSQKKKSNFAGFSQTNSQKKCPISREFPRAVSLKNNNIGKERPIS